MAFHKKKPPHPRARRIGVLIAFILIAQAAGLIGAIVTTHSLEWYETLEKPSFTPPSWVFGPIWLVLYLLIGVSGFLVWKTGSEGRAAMNVFAAQLILNALWSLIFFGLQAPAIAFGEIVLLWGSIVLTMSRFYSISKPAAYLLIPYIIWVMIAATLNAGIWILSI